MLKRKRNIVRGGRKPLGNVSTAPDGTGPGSNPSEVLLKRLDMLSDYYSAGLGTFPIDSKMETLLAEAFKHSKAGKIETISGLAQELRQVEEIINKYHGEKEALIQILLDINAQYHWLPKTALLWVSERLGVPLTQIYHIGSFYKAFSLVPQGRHMIQVCLGTACQVRGAPRLLDLVNNALDKLPAAEKQERFTLTTVNCLGCCALGPVMVIDEDHYSNPSLERIQSIFTNYK
jgi:NADH-quinone oxidoreductase subunit E